MSLSLCFFLEEIIYWGRKVATVGHVRPKRQITDKAEVKFINRLDDNPACGIPQMQSHELTLK
jgi:hypothetical protein